MKKALLTYAFLFLPVDVNAEDVAVPYLPNGLVDMERVVPTFSASFPIYRTEVPSVSGRGAFLGVDWTAEIADFVEGRGRITTFALGLARDGDALLAVWASHSFCSLNGYPNSVNMGWTEAEFFGENSFSVPFECLVAVEGEGS